MSVAEQNLLSNKLVTARRAVANNDRTETQANTHQRDIFRRISTKDICMLARQLATLLRAGLPLVPALSAIVEQLQDVPKRRIVRLGTQKHPLAEIMQQVADRVNAGSTLADALRKHPGVFSSLFVNMVAAGEESGTLEEILLRLAEMLEKRVHLASKVKSAVAYPAMMTVVAAGVVVFLLSFVVPSITQIFLEMNRALPWPTRLLIATSALIKTYFMLIAVVLFTACLGIGAWLRTKDGRLIADSFKLKLPLFGNLFLKLEIVRLTRTLGILLASGIPILRALEIAKGVIKNSFLAGALTAVKDSISKGDAIANAIRKTGLFPPIVFHVIATAQVSGNVEDGLINIADMYEGEVESTAKMLTSLLEPAILVVMGAVVGFIVLAILLPIFEINQIL